MGLPRRRLRVAEIVLLTPRRIKELDSTTIVFPYYVTTPNRLDQRLLGLEINLPSIARDREKIRFIKLSDIEPTRTGEFEQWISAVHQNPGTGMQASHHVTNRLLSPVVHDDNAATSQNP
tara:strand:- start:82 stop:441 length:360 start_codon:yes stop_codon:yes gene_type:complete